MKRQNLKWTWVLGAMVLASCVPDKSRQKLAPSETVVVYEQPNAKDLVSDDNDLSAQSNIKDSDPNRVLGTVGDDNDLDSMQLYDAPPSYMRFDRLFPSDDLNWAANF